MKNAPGDLEYRLVLASRSPRRAELLRAAGYDFDIDPADDSVEENQDKTRTPWQLVADLALAKALNVAGRIVDPSVVVLGADTVGELDGQVLGKPVDVDHARTMLRQLSGRRHRVLTGVSLCCGGGHTVVVHVEPTRLVMDDLSDSEIDEYLETGLWAGKAAAFGYQDGPDWLHVLEGLESNVVGLPVERLPELLQQLLE